MREYFYLFIYYFSVDCSTDKPKQFRWNFHKKTKNANSNSSQSVVNTKKTEEANSIEDGILRLYELIEFLSKPDSKLFILIVKLNITSKFKVSYQQ